MYKIFLLVILLTFASLFCQAQTKKFDTTIKMGDVGYKITCNNKKPDNNSVSILPIGFKDFSQNLTFPITGVLKKAMIDDYNNDGYPDLFFYSFDEKDRAQAYALASMANKSCSAMYMPDVYNDPKLRDGYQGHDEFSSMGGFIIRKFPVYKITDSAANTTSITGERVIEYKAKINSSNTDNPTYKFEIFKTYDVKK